MNYSRRIETQRPYSSRQIKKRQRSVQDVFLGRCKYQKIPLRVALKNDTVREGRIIAFDNWTLLFTDGKEKVLIFKSGILSLTPLVPMDTGNIVSYPATPDELKERDYPFHSGTHTGTA